MTTGEMLVGMEIYMGCQRSFDFIRWARVEAIGVDWAVLRDEEGRPWLADVGEIHYFKIWDKEKDEAREH